MRQRSRSRTYIVDFDLFPPFSRSLKVFCVASIRMGSGAARSWAFCKRQALRAVIRSSGWQSCGRFAGASLFYAVNSVLGSRTACYGTLSGSFSSRSAKSGFVPPCLRLPLQPLRERQEERRGLERVIPTVSHCLLMRAAHLESWALWTTGTVTSKKMMRQVN